MSEYTVSPVVRSNTDLFDAKDSAAQPLTTFPADGGGSVPLAVVVISTDVTGLILAGTVSVGTNSPNYNNIASGIVLPVEQDDVRIVPLTGILAIAIGNEGAEVKIKMSTVSIATEHLFKAALVAYQQS